LGRKQSLSAASQTWPQRSFSPASTSRSPDAARRALDTPP